MEPSTVIWAMGVLTARLTIELGLMRVLSVLMNLLLFSV